MPVMNVARFERFFRMAAGLDVDKGDLKRYDEFLSVKLHDLLERAQQVAKANDHDAILPWDLPITKGLQEDIAEFRQIDEDLEIEPILAGLAKLPLLDVPYSRDTEKTLPAVAGGVSVALARSLKIVNPRLRNPTFEDWDRAFRLFDLLI
jgi:hypothetical protein